MERRYGVGEDAIARYVCHKAPCPIHVDGDLSNAPWAEAPRSSRFVDLVSGEPGMLDTRMAALWDEKALYVAFWAEEPQVRASLTARDSFIWFDNDVEVFIGGEDCYYEFEMNALGTIYEVFFIYQDALRKGSRFDIPEFDLYEREVDVLAGFQDASRCGKHPRGKRWAFMDWDWPSLRAAVKVEGTINHAATVDRGWTAEIAFPWEGMSRLFGSRRFPPKDGEELRASFSRFEALRVSGRTLPESAGWALNAHGVYDSHIPECFSRLVFVDSFPGSEQ